MSRDTVLLLWGHHITPLIAACPVEGKVFWIVGCYGYGVKIVIFHFFTILLHVAQTFTEETSVVQDSCTEFKRAQVVNAASSEELCQLECFVYRYRVHRVAPTRRRAGLPGSSGGTMPASSG